MATRIGTENDPIKMLEHLMALDFDAVAAYQAAIDRLENLDYQTQLAGFKADHQRHIRELEPVVRQLGGTPPTKPDAKGMLTKGKVVMANLGGDDAILKAMKTNEDDTNTAYERAQAKAPPEALDILTRGLADERRHRDWIVATLETMAGRRPGETTGREHRPGL